MEEAVSAALRVETFSENNVLPSNYPFLADLQDSRGRQIGWKTNKDIQKLLREIVKMSPQVKSVEILKVVNSNNVTTSLVEVPCSSKQSGFKVQSRRSGWVKQRLHQLGLKNNRRTRTISNKDRKYQLYTKWEQICGNREVQSIKTSIHLKRKRELTTTRGSDTAYKIQSEKKYHCKEALEVDTSQWMGENAFLGPSIILRQDAAERCTLLAEQ